MPPSRKFASGYEKRKKKKRIETLIQSQKGALDKFVCSSNRDRTNEQHEVRDEVRDEVMDVDNEQEHEVSDEVRDVNEEHEFVLGDTSLDIYDPGNWNDINKNKIYILVEKGPIRVDIRFPLDPNERHFSSTHYTRNLLNGEKQDRTWLVYSRIKDKVFCFCCKLFTTYANATNTQLCCGGLNDWKNFRPRLQTHESSKDHMNCMSKWIELEKRLRLRQTIDKSLQEQINKEKEYWKQVLVRIIALVQCLAKNNVAFHGESETIYQENKGIFFSLIETITEFDPIMQEHVRQISQKEIQYHYLSHKIQNEMIQLLANNIKQSIIARIQQLKYFAVILDCTPDISHEEQMTLILRCVDVTKSPVHIKEFFLEFLVVEDTSGLGLFNELKNVLSELGFNIDDIRGQGYDNGSNMKGKHKGVQKKLLDENPRAFYTPCGCHSLNLALCDMAESCIKASHFFGMVGRIYNLFSSSTKRWKIFTDNVTGLTVKPLCSTRWESHIESVRAIKNQTLEIRDALLVLASTSDQPSTSKSEAWSLANNELQSFEFLISTIIWYDVLYAINGVSKTLQVEVMQIDIAIQQLKALISFFEKYIETSFAATIISNTMGIHPDFQQGRIIRRKKHFDENVREDLTQTPEEAFKVTYFLFVVDQALSSLNNRFEPFQEYEENFGFLFKLRELKSMDDETLKTCCTKFREILKHGNEYDIDSRDLFVELKIVRECLPKEIKKAIEVLHYVEEKKMIFPNVWISYRVLLTIPVTVASAERSFSKLKLIKSYLRSTMSQERLNGLAMISIENDVIEKFDYNGLIDEFASKCSRRKVFKS